MGMSVQITSLYSFILLTAKTTPFMNPSILPPRPPPLETSSNGWSNFLAGRLPRGVLNIIRRGIEGQRRREKSGNRGHQVAVWPPSNPLLLLGGTPWHQHG